MQSKPTQAHGPYIVSLKRLCPACTHGPAAGGEHRPESVSRRAVATLDEARGQVEETVDALTGEAVAAEIPKSGGTVSLPDGTVIEVEPTNWYELNAAAGLTLEDTTGDGVGRYTAADEAKIIAAYNAAQAEGLMS